MNRTWWYLAVMLASAHPSVLMSPPVDVSAIPMQGNIRGVVYDSLAARPLAGAIVQLAPTDGAASSVGAAISDSLGRYAFSDVPHGRYAIGFLHPVLDSLGLEPMLRAVTVEGTETVRADLAVPSAARLRLTICGGGVGATAAAVVTGMVRDARTGEPVGSARVAGAWAEITLGRNGVQRRVPRMVTHTRSNGWYAICGVPSQGSVHLMASMREDSTDIVEVDMPMSGLLRRDLYLGAARQESRTVVVDSQEVRTRIIIGDGVIRGTVASATPRRQRLTGAQVAIVNGPDVRSNDRGEFVITNAPLGTRTLEVRAVGYYPLRVAVDIAQGVPPVHAELVTFKSMLDTIKVRANYQRYSDLAGFRERSASGVGQFLTQDDIARRQPQVTSDLFRTVSGLFLDGPRGIDQPVLMRGTFDARCTPTVSLNGALMSGLSVNEIDAFVSPREILGIEVYASSYVPAQFQSPMAECGSIVIWTR
jgi:hypothetical protein